jgi:para-aminobenzoate synthetase component I
VVTDGWAVAGGRLLGRVVDVTDDPAALDSSGFWVVVMTFEEALRCVRFADAARSATGTTQRRRGSHQAATNRSRRWTKRPMFAASAASASGSRRPTSTRSTSAGS